MTAASKRGPRPPPGGRALVAPLLVVAHLVLAPAAAGAGGSEALIAAAARGDSVAVAVLLAGDAAVDAKAGANARATLKRGNAALELATQNGHAEAVALLRAAGARE